MRSKYMLFALALTGALASCSDDDNNNQKLVYNNPYSNPLTDYIEKVLGQRVYKNVRLFLPESFEWTLLQSGLIPNNEIPKILKDPSSYIESRDYLSWERFFTDVLVKYSADTRYAYKKTKLNEQYLKPQAMNAVANVLPECLKAE